MMRASLALGGAIVSCLVGAAMQPAAADDSQPTTVHRQASAQYDTRKQSHPPTDVPRGDLRGDIINNVRGRPDVKPSGAEKPPREKSKPNSR